MFLELLSSVDNVKVLSHSIVGGICMSTVIIVITSFSRVIEHENSPLGSITIKSINFKKLFQMMHC